MTSSSTTVAGCALARSSATTPTFTAAHPRILVNHAQTLACLQQQLAAGAPAATKFKGYVDSELANPGSNWEFEYWQAALLGKVTGSGQYLDLAVSRIDAFVRSEENKVAGGGAATVAGDSYLHVGRLVGDVALVYDWAYDRLTAEQRTRWINYMNQAVWNVWNYRNASWGGKSFPWSGWGTDNPANNYYYSFLKATMLVGLATRGENPSAQGWIDTFRTTKLGNELVPYFNIKLQGGGSREGTGYGAAMRSLFQLYDWWERSTGERIATLTPHTLESASWWMHNIAPGLNYLAHTGDQARESTALLFDYHREYLLVLMSLFPQERISGAAKTLLDNSTVPQMANRFEYFADYLYAPASSLPAVPMAELPTVYYGIGTGQFLMRNDWSKGSVFSRLACGPYTESHAHRDQGSFLLYKGGEWLAPSGHIFTASGIEQQEEMHNLVRVEQNGATVKQAVNTKRCQYWNLDGTDEYIYAAASVTPVYNGHPAISKVEREYVFIKPSTFVVFDRVASAAGTRRVWTLNLAGAPTVSGDHLTFTAANANKLDVYRVAPSGLTYTVNTPVLVGPDKRVLNPNAKRIDVADTAGTQSNFLHVLGTNGSVQSATRLTTAASETGARIQLADGRVANVYFSNTGFGGTRLEILPAGSTATTAASGTTASARAQAASVGGRSAAKVYQLQPRAGSPFAELLQHAAAE